MNGSQTEAAIDALGYQAEWVSTNRRPAPGTDVVLAGGGLTSVHSIGDLAGDQEALARIEQVLAGVEGSGSIHDKQAQAAMPSARFYGDLVVEPQPGWAMFAADADHTRGRHGTTQELQVAFLLSGACVRPGAAPQDPRHVDVAPRSPSCSTWPPRTAHRAGSWPSRCSPRGDSPIRHAVPRA